MKPLRLYGEDWFPLVRDEFVPGVGWVKRWTATRLVNRCGVVIAAR